MLSKKNRIGKRDFNQVLKKGFPVFLGNIGAKVLKNKRKEIRVGFLIGKKNAKKAVERNKIKRALSASVAAIINKLRPGMDIVFFIPGQVEKNKFKIDENVAEKIVNKINPLIK